MKKKLFLGISSLMILSTLSAVSAQAVEQQSVLNKNAVSAVSTQTNENVYPVSLEEYNNIISMRDEYREIQNDAVSIEKFIELPVLQDGVYTLGTFKVQTTENATRNLNFMRKLAGVSEIPYSQSDFETSQYGAVGMAAALLQKHGLDDSKKPEDMPDSFWEKAKQATNSSSIHSHFKEVSLEYHTRAFMTDFGYTNTYAGHRSHMLGIANTSVGFGYAIANGNPESGIKYYTSVYATQNYTSMSSRYSNDTIAYWPAEGLFPYELYNTDNPYADEAYANRLGQDYEKNMRWTVHFNLFGYRLTENIKVTIENTETNELTVMKNDDNSGELTIATVRENMYGNDGYNTVIFRPNNDFTAEKNVLYKVKIGGILKDGKEYTHEYETKFVGLEDNYEIKAEKIELPQALEVELNQDIPLTVTVLPEEATDKTVIWTTSDESIASVNAQGEVTGLKEGTAIITASTKSGKVKSSCVVTVTPEKPKGTFGTTTWVWDKDSQTVAFSGGEFPVGDFSEHYIRDDIENHSLLGGLKIKKIVFTAPVKLNSRSSYMFSSLSNLEAIEGIELLDTSEVVMMKFMFSGCTSLKKLDLSHFDTSNVYTMSNMFKGMSRLTELDLSSFNTGKVQFMDSMFNNVTNLTELDLSHFDTSSVLSMGAMFDGMKNLTSLDVSNFNTSNVRDMFAMFAYLEKIELLDIGHFDTGKVTNMGSMFARTYELKKLDVSNFNTENVNNMAAMFSYARKLSELDVSNFETGKVTSMYSMFREMQELQQVDVSNFKTDKVTDMSHMFREMTKVTKIDMSNFDTRNAKNMDAMFLHSNRIEELILGTNSKLSTVSINLNEIVDEFYTGKWLGPDGVSVYDTTKEFILNYDGSQPGKYVREKI
ncbi:BspA family leucine-rich repeat surface protein [Enterococcus sp. BWB1-3]|uniref:BspA family leucine-rich repeat surface protein n=1 Tax=Enterococcus sp. BWB1-3 TaxID=2787713 RepID=UPI001920F6B3|nr:BspA family leucine-rich repeat surface protein [Enterococcus sp. BWB1-3]MBL1230622.1 BspA family leucine-rich repeat surface protein [Enterococcus sp. BWB1-3]